LFWGAVRLCAHVGPATNKAAVTANFRNLIVTPMELCLASEFVFWSGWFIVKSLPGDLYLFRF
jgi:hypothetical protein